MLGTAGGRRARVHQLCKRRRRGKIVYARFWILYIERHRQVALLQQSMPKPANIRGFKRESSRQFPRDRKVHCLCVRSFEFVVKSKRNLLQRITQAAYRRRVRKRSRGRRIE